MRHSFISSEKGNQFFAPESLICRFLACWLSVTAVHLIRYEGFDLVTYASQFRHFASWLVFLLLFTGSSVLSWFFPKSSHDSFLLLAAALTCAIAVGLRTSDFFFLLPVIIGLFFTVLYFDSKNRGLLCAIRLRDKTLFLLVTIMSLFSFAVMAANGVFRYLSFSAPNFDFGIFCNMFAHMKETGLPLVSCERDTLVSHFAVHLSPICYLLLPFYAVFPFPATLAVSQAALLAFGALPLMLLTKRQKFTPGLRLFTVGLYCFYPALTVGTFYDFHENCFLAPLLLWTAWFCLEKKRLPAALTALGVCMVKEDAPVYIMILALYLFFGEKDRLFAALLGLMAAAYFAGALFLLDRFGFGIMSGRYEVLMADPEDGLFGVLKTAWENPAYVLSWIFKTSDGTPDKLIYLLSLLLPLGFLPLCSRKPSRYLLSCPILINLITSYPYQYQLRFQYHFGILALLFFGMIRNINEIPRSARRVLCSFAACACLTLYVANAIPSLTGNVTRYFQGREQYHTMEEVLASIPEEDSVTASGFLIPHLASHNEIYEIEYHEGEPYTDYVVIDAREDSAIQLVTKYENLGYTVRERWEKMLIVMINEQIPPGEKIG